MADTHHWWKVVGRTGVPSILTYPIGKKWPKFSEIRSLSLRVLSMLGKPIDWDNLKIYI